MTRGTAVSHAGLFWREPGVPAPPTFSNAAFVNYEIQPKFSPLRQFFALK
jgi:hypothetical protein